MNYQIDTLINFVAVTPGGGGGGDVPGGGGSGAWAAQTGDVLGIVIAALLAVVCIAFFAVKVYARTRAFANAEAEALTSKRAKTASWILMALMAVLACACAFNVVSTQAAAKQQASNGEITAPTAIEAHVDETAGTVTIDNSYLMNPNSEDSVLNSITLTNPEGIDDGGATWNVNALGGTLYNDVAGKTVTFTDTKTIAAGSTQNITITTNMDIATAKALIGKSVLNMSFAYSDSPTPPPPPPTDPIKITGVALDADGLPMANATVTLYDEAGNAIATATTDVNGNYTLTLPDDMTSLDKGRIKVKTADGISQDIVVENVTQDTTLTEKARVEPSTTISGQVLDEDGNPVAGAEVTYTTVVTYPDGTSHVETFTGITDENGNYEIDVKQDNYYIETVDKNTEPQIHTSDEIAVEKTPIENDIDVSKTLYTVTVNLGSGSAKIVPDGWTSATAGVYTKRLSAGSSIDSIADMWVEAGITPPTGKAFIEIVPQTILETLQSDTTFTADYEDYALITGHAKNAEGHPLLNGKIYFYPADGSDPIIADIGSGGNFELQIPPNTPGTFYVEGPKGERSPDFEVSGNEGVTQIPSAYVEETVDLEGTVYGPDGSPLANAEVEIETYVERDGKIVKEVYKTKTDANGKYTKKVQKNKDYTIKVEIPGSDPEIDITSEVKVQDQPVVAPVINVPSKDQTAVATINLNGGRIARTLSGWQKTTAGTYTKTFAKGSTYASIVMEWTNAEVTPPVKDQVILSWTPEKGTLSADTTFKATWGEAPGPTPTGHKITGKVVDEYGNPKGGIAVTFTDSNGKVIKVTSDKEGEYEISPVESGTTGKLEFHTPVPRSIASEQEITVGDEDVAANPSVIEPSTIISGTVYGPDGKVLPNAEITFTTKTYVDGEKIVETFTTKTDENGSYKTEVKKDKQYEMEIHKSGEPDVDFIQILDVTSDSSETDNINIPDGDVLTFKMILGQGTISAEDVPSGWTKTTEKINTYQKAYINHKGLTDVIINLWTNANIIPPEGKVLAMIFNEVSEPTTFAAKYSDSHKLSGKIVDSEGQSVMHAKVTIYDENNNVVKEVITDENGNYEADLPAGGEYKVKATLSSGTSSETKVGPLDQDTELPNIEVLPKSTVHGQISEPDGSPHVNAGITLKRTDEAGEVETFSTITNSKGLYSVDVAIGYAYSISVYSEFFGTYTSMISVAKTDESFNYIYLQKIYKIQAVGIANDSPHPEGWEVDSVLTKSFVEGSNIEACLAEWDGIDVIPEDRNNDKILAGWDPSSGTLVGNLKAAAKWKLEAAFSTNDSSLGNVTISPSTFNGYIPFNSTYAVDGKNKITVSYDGNVVVSVSPNATEAGTFKSWTLNGQATDPSSPLQSTSNFLANFVEKSDNEAYAAIVSSRNGNNDTLAFKYDNQRSAFQYTFDVLDTGENVPAWRDYIYGANASVTLVNIDKTFINVQPKSMYCWFEQDTDDKQPVKIAKFVGLENIDTSTVTTMYSLFRNVSKPTGLPGIGSWKTGSNMDIKYLFCGCSGLTEPPDVGKWDVKNAHYANYTFAYCSSVTKMPSFSAWEFSPYQTIGMFEGCTNLTEVTGINGWSVYYLMETDYMFKDTTSLTHVPDISKWGGYLQGCDHMFENSGIAGDVDISGWNVCPDDGGCEAMFKNCKSVTSIKLNNRFLSESYAWASSMFEGCDKLRTIYTNVYYTSIASKDHQADMFKGCTSLRGGNGFAFDASGPVDATYAKPDSYSDAGYFTPYGTDTTKLVYDLNGQACDASHNTQYYNYSQTILTESSFTVQGATQLAAPACTDGSGKTFKCWYLDGDATHHEYKAGDALEAPAGSSSMKLIAQWDGGKVPCAVYSNPTAEASKGSLTFYCDEEHTPSTEAWKGTDTYYVFALPKENYEDYNSIPWFCASAFLGTVSFDESFKNYQLKNLSYWFYSSNLSSIDWTYGDTDELLDTSQVTKTNSMFSGTKFKEMIFPQLDFSKNSNYGFMFNSSSVEKVDFSNIIPFKGDYGSDWPSARCVFQGCDKLTEVNLTNLRVYDGAYIFYAANNINTIIYDEDWHAKFITLDLSNENWIHDSGKSYNNNELPSYGTSSHVWGKFTKPTNKTTIEVNSEQTSMGNIQGPKEVYNNESHAGTYSIDGTTITFKISGTGETSTEYSSMAVGTGGATFSKWQLNGEDITSPTGTLADNQTFTAFFETPVTETPKAVFTSADATLTFYYDSTDHSGEGVTQFDITEDTHVDLSDQSSCVLPPWEELDSRYNLIPIPKVYPTYVVFDSSFSKFEKYEDGDAFTSMDGWFFNFFMTTSYSGFQNIANCVVSANMTFCNFGGLGEDENQFSVNADTVLDLSMFNQTSLTYVTSMFSSSVFSKLILPNKFAPKATAFGGRATIASQELVTGLFSLAYFSNITINGTIGTGVTDFSGMYSGCSYLVSQADSGIDKVDFSNADKLVQTFSGIGFETFTFPSSIASAKPSTIQNIFAECLNLKSIDFTNFNSSALIDMFQAFANCPSLNSLDLSGLNLSSVNDMGQILLLQNEYVGQASLTEVKFPSEPGKLPSSITVASNMFFNQSKLKTIYAPTSFTFSDDADSSNMFYNCTSLMGGNGFKFDSSITDKSVAVIDEYGTQGYLTCNYQQRTLVYNMGEHAVCDASHNVDYWNYQQTVSLHGHFTVQGASNLPNPQCTDSSGYEFAGWLYNGKIYNANEEFTPTNSDKFTFVAQWEIPGDKVAHAVCYQDENGNDALMEFVYDSNTYTPGTDVTGKGTISAVYPVTGNADKPEEFPAWINVPEGKVFFNPAHINFDSSFKDFTSYEDEDGNSVEFNSLTYFFAKMSPTLTESYDKNWITGWENIAADKIVSMDYCFVYSLNNLQGKDLELNFTGFQQNNLASCNFMLLECYISKLIVPGNFAPAFTDYGEAREGYSNSPFCGCYFKSISFFPVTDSEGKTIKYGEKITNAICMFGCDYLLENIDTEGLDLKVTKSICGMFNGCEKLTSISLSAFVSSSQVSDCSYCFSDCKSLEDVNLSNLDISALNNCKDMFYDCSALKCIKSDRSWNLSYITNSSNMFEDCTSLMGGNGYKFNSSSDIDKTYARIDYHGEQGYFTYNGSDASALTYNLNGGSLADNPQYDGYQQTVQKGTAFTVQGATKLNDPLRFDGYTFKCWKYYNVEYSAGTSITASEVPITLVAQWEAPLTDVPADANVETNSNDASNEQPAENLMDNLPSTPLDIFFDFVGVMLNIT